MDRAVSGEMKTAGGSNLQFSSALQCDFDRLFAGDDLAAIAQDGFSMRDLHRSRDLHLGSGRASNRLLSRQHRGKEEDPEQPHHSDRKFLIRLLPSTVRTLSG